MQTRLPKLLLALTSVWIISSCKDETAPEPPNEFNAVLSGALNDTIFGPAIFGGPTASQDMVRLAGRDSSNTSGATILIMQNSSDNWVLGSHSLGTGGTANMLVFNDTYTGYGLSGTVTITTSTPRTVAGTFNGTVRQTVEGAEPQDVNVSGTFRAKCNWLPTQTCVAPF